MHTVSPNKLVAKDAHVRSMNQYNEMQREALTNPGKFWLDYALKFFWKEVPSLEKCLSYNFDIRKGSVFVKWFSDGTTNICYNALDVHIEKGYGANIAFHWEGNDPNDCSSVTYEELLINVKKFAHVLKSLGVRDGDCVAIYMPMVPEIVVAMLACARIGAIHSVVFGGFSANALASRIIDAKCKILITCDGAWRGSKLINLKANADTALSTCEDSGYSVSHCIILRHVTVAPKVVQDENSHLPNGQNIPGVRPAEGINLDLKPGRDLLWNELMDKLPEDIDCPIKWMNAEDPLFILYTSGSTGKPKGVVHTVGGYMVYAATTFLYTFDYHKNDVYWCTADAGWITGHTYVVYGPMLNGATSVMFEGIPTWPDPGRCWAIVDRYHVNKFYTAPTALRTLMASGDEFVLKHSRKSLRILGSVGEPINPTAWEWYHNVIGNGRCAIVDTFWQTETGGHVITPLPGATPTKPGCATRPFFGVDVRILSDKGEDLTANARHRGVPVEGFLVFAAPWPGMMRTLYGDHKRYEEVYFSRFPGYYVAGDGAKMDEDGDIWITGRIDDMLNVSGHLISTSEVESVLLRHPLLAEAAVVSRSHPVKGECLHCFVVLKQNNNSVSNGSGSHDCSEPHKLDATVRADLCVLVRKHIGPFATPDHMQQAKALPKTRSGKVMRRLLRKIANLDFDFGDTSTLADPTCLDDLVEQAKQT